MILKAKLSGKVGYVVADARTGAVLEERNQGLALPPASVTKAVTALYALDRLGPGFRFRTRLVADGTVSNGRLRGNLILVGGGDPTLDTDALGDMARQLKAAGVREVTGKFLVYGGVLPTIPSIDPGQPVHVSYNPAVSGLNLNYNRVHFEWKRQSGNYALKLDARARRYSPQVAIAKMRVVDRSLPVYTYASKSRHDEWTVARGALGNAGSRWLPVRKPGLYAAEVFQNLARAHGVSVPRAKVMTRPPLGTTLVEHKSAPLRDILRAMMKFSTNLTAEVVGVMASNIKGGSVKTLKSSANKMTAWARKSLGMRTAKFVDHSGLGGASRVSATDMVTALRMAAKSNNIRGIFKDIPMRNDKGDIVENHPVKVRAKTGTLNFVSALAGYASAADGRELVFAIFTADVQRRNQIKRSDGDVPEGTRAWRARSRRLQIQLLDRWGRTYAV
ncbi:D-alanyl-D-alanine carboxypeptidase [Candidatus Rhodobacter oscarellae]|uniref:D-alanyl-D-alanine carboxypeptidase n=1 Tax=Candidatus Rhodobacter oscarellae TaxID=1675527 RepID=A0A0J9E8G8_9RHOB|nr:D-alanyl-D-alanine carboxypeptidase [Candidatus Rhodobacter lobularis]